MKTDFEIKNVRLVTDPSTFMPKIACLVYFDVEQTDDETVIYQDGYVEKKFYNDFFKQLGEKFQTSNGPKDIYIWPLSIGECLPASENDLVLEFPLGITLMNQALRPIISGDIEMQTMRLDYNLDAKFINEISNDKSQLYAFVQDIQEYLLAKGVKYFYYALIKKTTNSITLQDEYTLMAKCR